MPRADKLTTFMCWLSWNLGASTFWNTQGLSRPVQGLLSYPYSLTQWRYVCPSENWRSSDTSVVFAGEHSCRDTTLEAADWLYLLPYCHQWIIWQNDKSVLMAAIIELLRILNVCWVFWRQQPAVAVISYPSLALIPSPLRAVPYFSLNSPFDR